MKVVLILAAAAALFFTGLGRSALFDQDEAKYTQVAREILQTGDPITMHVNGEPWFVHPPLYMWLQALTGRIFGFTEFTARLWSAVFGVIGIYATFLLARRLFSERVGLLAALVLPATFQYFAQSRLAIFDVVLVAFMFLAFYAFLRALLDGDRAQAYYAAMWAGLGTLTKGPIALLLPGLVAVAYLILRRGRLRWTLPWIGPAALYAAVAAPWYLIEWARWGWPFMQTVIGYYTVNRFVGVVEGQSGPWWYYGPVFGFGMFPWTAFLIAMIPYHLRRRVDDGSLLVLLWVAIPVAFYTAAGTKLPNYVLPVYPAAAVGIAAMWDTALRGDPAPRPYLAAAFATSVGALLIFAAEIAAFARIKYPTDLAALQRHLVTVGVVLAIWLFAASALYAARRPGASFAVLVATTWILAGMLVIRTLPLIEARRSIKEVAAVATARLAPGIPLVGFRISDHQTLLYYTNHRVLWVDSVVYLTGLACFAPRLIVVSTPPQVQWWKSTLPAYGDPRLHPVLARDDLTVLQVDRARSCRVPLIGR